MAEYWIYPDGFNGYNDGETRWYEDSPGLADYSFFVDAITIPENGWIIGLSSKAGGYTQSMPATNVLYSMSGGAISAIVLPPLQTWGTGTVWRTQNINPIFFRKNSVVWAGFWRDKDYQHVHRVANVGGASHIGEEDSVGSHYPDDYQTRWDVWSGALATGIKFRANSPPGGGMWIDPSPSGVITDRNPIFSGTLPHPDDDAFDRTDLIDFWIRHQETNDILITGTFNPHTNENAHRKFSRRFGISLPTGLPLSATYRHRDSWGVWAKDSQPLKFRVGGGPSTPVWVNPPDNTKINSLKPAEYRGTYNHSESHAFAAVNVQIYNSTKNIKLHDSGDLSSDVAVALGGEWVVGTGWHPSLIYGHVYMVRARTKDINGAYSNWGNWVKITVNSAPSVPKDLIPSEGQITESPVLQATVVDPDGDAITGGKLKLFDVTNNVTVYSAIPWAASTSLTLNSYRRPTSTVAPAALGYVAKYKVIQAGTTGTTEPIWPTTLNATVTDGTVIWQFVGDNAAEFDMSPSNLGVGIIETNLSAHMTLGRIYRWQCRGTDGHLYSTYSENKQFRYAESPRVTMLAPSVTPLTNLIDEPSAEYASKGFWTEYVDVNGVWTLPNGVNTWPDGSIVEPNIARLNDDDATSGSWVWRMINSARPASKSKYESAYIPIATNRNYLLHGQFKEESGTVNGTFRLDCFDNANTLLGSIHPNTYTALNNTPLNNIWNQRGGFFGTSVSGLTFPLNTTKVKVVIILDTADGGVTRWDAMFLAEVPLTSNFTDAQPWYGFFDGDYTGYGVEDDFIWTQTVGASPSRGYNIATEPSLTLVTTYSSSMNYAKTGDKIYIDRWEGTKWVSVFASKDWAGGTRTLIPLPSVFRNLGKYRVKIEALDSTGVSGSTPWVVFTTMFEGPPELGLVAVIADNDDATIMIRYNATTLDALKFVETEIVLEEVLTGIRTTIAIIRDPLETEFLYHFPVSGMEYEVLVRQTEQIGSDRIQSRWSRQLIQVVYPEWMVKDIDDPTTVFKFLMLADDTPTESYELEWTPMREWGEELPVHFPNEGRPEDGKFTARLLEGDAGLLDKMSTITTLRKNMRRVVILTQRPAEKIFAVLTSIGRSRDDMPFYATYDINWEKTSYIEDVLYREENVSEHNHSTHTH